MAISLKQKIAEDIANLIASNVSKVRVFFDDNSTTDLSTANNTEHDADNNCYYANISFLISSSASKTIVKIEFYNASDELLFIDKFQFLIGRLKPNTIGRSKFTIVEISIPHR